MFRILQKGCISFVSLLAKNLSRQNLSGNRFAVPCLAPRTRSRYSQGPGKKTEVRKKTNSYFCMKMFRFLRQPYPFINDYRHHLKVAVYISVFVVLFLFLFKPFGLGNYQG